MPGVLTLAFYHWLLIPLLPGLSAGNPRCYAILPANISVKISKGKRKKKILNINHHIIMITPKILRIISLFLLLAAPGFHCGMGLVALWHVGS